MMRPNSDPVLTSVDKLESALTADVPGHEEEWTLRVHLGLLDLENVLRTHKAAAEGQDGMFDSMNDLSPEMLPTLDRQLQKLCGDHSDFLKQANTLKTDVQNALEAFQSHDKNRLAGTESFGRCPGATCVPDFGAIRQRGTELLNALRKHRETETKLLMESALIDVGVGD